MDIVGVIDGLSARQPSGRLLELSGPHFNPSVAPRVRIAADTPKPETSEVKHVDDTRGCETPHRVPIQLLVLRSTQMQ